MECFRAPQRGCLWPFFTVTGVRPGRKLLGVKPPNFGVLYGRARAAENIIIAWKYLAPNRGLTY
jgi:hypothetical protein